MSARVRHHHPRRPAPPPVAPLDAAAHVAPFAETCVRAVQRSLGLALDFDPDTIPLLDHYLSLLPDRPRAATRDPVRGLVATLTGAYFGEVVHRRFPCRWVASPDDHPLDWRIEFRYCLLAVHPVAVAWEVLLRRDATDGSAAFLLDEPTRAQIAQRLDTLPGATLGDYYTFAQRLETLELTAGWLAEQVQLSGRPPVEVTQRSYERLLARIRTRE